MQRVYTRQRRAFWTGLSWPAGPPAFAPTVAEAELSRRFGAVECAPYPEPPAGAMLLPLCVAGSDRPYGMLVAGVSARSTFFSSRMSTKVNRSPSPT